MRTINLTTTIKKEGKRSLVSVSLKDDKNKEKGFESINFRKKSRNGTIQPVDNIYPLTMDDINVMLTKPKIIKTLIAGTYKLESDFSEVISHGTTGSYIEYKELS